MTGSMIETFPRAEFETRPNGLIVYSPENVQWTDVDTRTLSEFGLIGNVSTDGFREQYFAFSDVLLDEGMNLLPFQNLIDPADLDQIDQKLNLMFTRDPATTIPWAPELFIPSNMSLASRRSEVRGMSRALVNLGMQPAIELVSEYNQYAEGGDLYPTIIDGERVLLVGVGTRTRTEKAKAIAAQLIPEVFDSVLLLQHDPEILHLDTGFTPLPNKSIFVAEDMFLRGMSIDRTNRSGVDIDNPIDYFSSLGYTTTTTTKHEAVYNETVNMVPIGNDTFVGFPLAPALKRELVDKSGARIVEVAGDQIAPAQGGAHCLTRPIFIDL